MLHSGIDLHKRDLRITTVDSAGTVVREGRVLARRGPVTAYFGALGADQRAVVESTATWYWLADLLRSEGVALTLYLEIDGITRFPDARHFCSYCRLVPGAKNSGGKTRHKRTKDGNRYLKLAFSHAAVRAIQYYPEIKRWYLAKRRTKGPMVARALVAKELARIVYVVLQHQDSFNGTFKGQPLSRTKQSQWPRRASPSA